MLLKLKQWLVNNKVEIVISVGVFIIAFLPRIINLTGHSIFTDEVLWQQRGSILIKAFSPFNFSLLTKNWQNYNTISIGLPSTVLIAISKLLLGRLTSPIFYSRFPFTIIGSLTAVGFYLFMRRINKPEIGIIGALFLALDPSFIAMSRWAHRDVMLTFLFFLSIAFFYLGETEDRFSFKIYSAVLFALAFLAKISAIIIPVILVLWKVLLYLRTSDNKKKSIFKILKFNFKLKELSLPFVSASVIFLLWPALWKSPFAFATTYFKSQFQELEGTHAPMLLLGKSYVVPPFYYYLVIIFIRLSPIILFSLVLGIIFFFTNKKGKSESDILTLVFIWLILFIAIASLSAKMYEVRYILPAWPAIAVFVGYGLFQSFSYIKKLNKNQIVAFSSALIVAFELPIAFIYSPNFYMYYNAFAGGPVAAHKNKTTLVGGGGEASKSLAIYATKHFNNINTKIVYYGFNNQFDYYLNKNMKKHVKYNLFKLKFIEKNKKFYLTKYVYYKDNDVVILEDAISYHDIWPSKEEILASKEYKVAYTSRILGTNLGWVFVKIKK